MAVRTLATLLLTLLALLGACAVPVTPAAGLQGTPEPYNCAVLPHSANRAT